MYTHIFEGEAYHLSLSSWAPPAKHFHITVAVIICKQKQKRARPNPQMVIRRQADKLAVPDAADPDDELGTSPQLSSAPNGPGSFHIFMAGLINLLSLAKFRGPTQTLTDRRLKFSANKQQTELQKQLAKSW